MKIIKNSSADLAVIRFLENTIMGNKEKYSVKRAAGLNPANLAGIESYDIYLIEPKTLLMTVFNYEKEVPPLVYVVVYEKECIISIKEAIEQTAILNLLHQFSNSHESNELTSEVIEYLGTF
jgi:uncharacterized membrane protein